MNYIVDFYCYELDLIIELDGRYHNNEDQYKLDISREKGLSEYDLTVIRFDEIEVRKDMVNVLRTIEQYIIEHKDKA